MFCIKCGNSLPDDADYCSKCGNPARSGVQAPLTAQRWEEGKVVYVFTRKRGPIRAGKFKLKIEVHGPSGIRHILESPEMDGNPDWNGFGSDVEKSMRRIISAWHTQLLADGWEPVENNLGYWWHKKYRRQVP